MRRSVKAYQVGSTPALRTMKNNLGNYIHQVESPEKFLRFDLTEGDCWFKEKVCNWFKQMDISDVIHYPDEKIIKTKKLLAKWLHIREKNIAIGNGSDELIEKIPKIFTNKGNKMLTVAPTFFRFNESSLRASVKIETVKLFEKNGFEWDNATVKRFLKKVRDKKVKLILLASPNNPTGIDIPKPVLLEVIKQGKVVILDKVLNGFTKELQEASHLVWSNPNLIVLSSFSKTFGLPGLRFGFAIGSRENIESLDKTRLPFNVTGPTLFIVEKLLQSLLSGEIKIKEGFNFIKERLFVEQQINKLDKIKLVTRSRTNFVLLKPVKNFNLFKKLLEKGILVTDLNQTTGIKNKNFIRVTLRDREKNNLLLKALKEIN